MSLVSTQYMIANINIRCLCPQEYSSASKFYALYTDNQLLPENLI